MKSDQVKRLKDLETENSRLRRAVSDLTLDKLILQGAAQGTTKPRASPRPASSMFAASCRSPSVALVRRSASIARRSARSRKAVTIKSGCRPTPSNWPDSMAATAIARSPSLLRRAGWRVNDKRVERIWRREGLKVPARQPKRSRLWLNDGSCIRLRAEHRNHVWSYDFVQDRTHNGRSFRMLNIIDEFTRECLTIRIGRKLRAVDVIDTLSDLFILRGVPGHIRSDNVLSAEGNGACSQGLSVRQHALAA